MADESDIEGFKDFTQSYMKALDIERLSVERFDE